MKTVRALGHLNTATFSGLQMILFTLIPFLAERSSLSLSSVILSFSVGSFLFLWASPYWASRSDSWGRMRVLIIGMAGLTISTGLLFGLILNPGSLLMNEVVLWTSRILYGLTASAIVPVSQALQMDLAPKDSALKSMLSNSMSLNVGRALGPLYLLVGGSDQLLGLLQGAVLWSLVLLIANMVFVARTLPQQAHQDNQFSLQTWMSSFKSVRGLFVLALIFTTFIGILNFSLASILKSTFALTSTESSVLMAQVLLGSAVFAVAVQALGRVVFKNPWQGSLVIGAVTLIVGSILLGSMESYNGLWGAIAMLSIGIALIPPSYLSLMAGTEGTQGVGRKTGLASAANTLGYTLGGLVAAVTFKIGYLEMETVMTLVVLLVAANIAWLYQKRTKSLYA